MKKIYQYGDKKAFKKFSPFPITINNKKKFGRMFFEAELVYVHGQTDNKHSRWKPVRWLSEEEYNNYRGDKD
ncbi:MAG: hypothetical protein R3B60_02740 [Candidatus Paceibacterota bacterium]